jgi:hypothetical protein
MISIEPPQEVHHQHHHTNHRSGGALFGSGSSRVGQNRAAKGGVMKSAYPAQEVELWMLKAICAILAILVVVALAIG